MGENSADRRGHDHYFLQSAEARKKAQKTAYFQGKLNFFQLLKIRQNLPESVFDFVRIAQGIISLRN